MNDLTSQIEIRDLYSIVGDEPTQEMNAQRGYTPNQELRTILGTLNYNLKTRELTLKKH